MTLSFELKSPCRKHQYHHWRVEYFSIIFFFNFDTRSVFYTDYLLFELKSPCRKHQYHHWHVEYFPIFFFFNFDTRSVFYTDSSIIYYLN